MGLETGTYISDLVVTNPVGASDAKSQGDDHLRLIKATLKNTFPNITGAMTLTHAQLNQAALKNTTNTFTSAQTMSELLISGILGVHRDVTNSGLVLSGGTANNGANIELYGSTAAGSANDAFVDADEINFRSANGTGDTAVTINGTLNVTGGISGAAAFPAGTRMLFQQTAAPTGWTKETVHNDKALRLTTGTVGTGGSGSFSSLFTNRTPSGTISNTTSTGTVQNHTLTAAQMPSHSHGASGLTFSGNALPGHSHTVNVESNSNPAEQQPAGTFAGSGQNYSTSSVSAGTPSGSIGGNTASAGSDQAHNHGLVMNAHGHTFTGDLLTFAVQYVDFIIAVKN